MMKNILLSLPRMSRRRQSAPVALRQNPRQWHASATAAFGVGMLLHGTPAISQNLVINPSFETISSCPNGPSELDKATPWRDAHQNLVGDTCSTADVFNSCSPFGAFGVGVPANILGNEPARTGNGYAGIIVYEGFALLGCQSLFGSGWREYLQGTLTEPLMAGQTYCVTFYVSLADNVKFASNNIGVYFSNTLVNVSCATVGGASNLPFTPQLVYAGPDLVVTNGWQRLQWDYTAAGGEQYIVIGNYNNDSNTNYTCVNEAAFNPYAYYYVDDVSVVPEPCCEAEVAPVPLLCLGDAPVTLQPATPGGTWSGPGIADPTVGSFDPALAGVGVHTVFHTIPCGTDSVIIAVSPCQSLEVCVNDDGSWTASNGVGPYSWQQETTTEDCSGCFIGCAFPPGCAVNVTTWTTFATGATIPAPSGLPVQVTDGGGTVLLITDVSTIPQCIPCPEITMHITAQTDLLCHGASNGSASVEADGGEGPYAYAWSPGGLTGPSQTGLSAGAYTVTATDLNGCTGTVTVTIVQPEEVVVEVVSTTDVTCAGNDGAATVSASGGTGTLTYLWSTGGGTPAITGLGPGSHTVTVTDANGCTGDATAVIGSTEGPVITDIAVTQSECLTPTGTITITATGDDLQYSIDGGNTYQSSASFAGVAAGTYDVQVMDADGCTVTATAVVSSPGAPVPVITGPAFGCAGDDLVLTTDQPYISYQWSDGSTGPTLQVASTGTYTVTVTDANGCTGTSAPFAVVVEAPDAAFTADPPSPQAPNTTVVFTDVSSGGTITGWEWSLGEQGAVGDTPEVTWTYTDPGTYDVVLVVTTANGCTDTTWATYIIRPVDIVIPNVFSPNSDGMNDTFAIENIEFFRNELVILNRWGMVIHEAKDYRNQWRANGHPDGTYYYVLRLEDGREFTGHVTVLR